jgi:hypothetical protein
MDRRLLRISACLVALTLPPALAWGQQSTPSAAPSANQPPSDELDSGPSVGNSRVGYVDSALPFSQFRLRFDAGYNHLFPNRAEFFYAQSAPGGPGLPVGERSTDYQEFTAYVETAVSERFSAFFEVPVRLINPEINDNSAGLSDVNAGFKYAFVCQDDLVATFQLRTYAPTGDADRGLGTRHVSIEPALLVYRPLGERLTFEGELRYWVPVGGTDFAGDIVRYGIGFSYNLWQSCTVQVNPVAELVGWTVLDGKKKAAPPPGAFPQELPADGDTIVNVKLGVRTRFGERTDIYTGYGRALTGQRWYDDVIRVDLRIAF